MKSKNIRFFLFGSILSNKKVSDINDIDLFILYDKKKIKNINKKVIFIKNYLLKTYNKKGHITILNFLEYEQLNKNLLKSFNLKELSLKEIKKILDIKFFKK